VTAGPAATARERAGLLLRRAARWIRHPPLTIRTRLTLTFATLFTMGGSVLVLALTTVFYRAIFRPLPANAIPSSLDPDHDHIIGLSDQIRDAAASHLLRVSLFLLLIVVAVSALLGWWIAGRMLRPIAAVTAAARRATDTTLHERLNLPGPPDELKELGDTFDEMLERLDAAFAAQRRFVANASHELRTPLALTRAAVEVTLAKPAATDEQWRTMAHDVAGSTEHAQRLIEALDQVAARSRARGLRLETELGPAVLRGNVALLGIAVANLLENAVKYNRDGGLLRVVTRPAGADWQEVQVANDGPPVSVEQLDHVFEPFHRGRHTRRSSAEPAREGVGLGLSIVRAVAQAHGGRVTAEARPSGGLSVTLRLPTSRGPAAA